MNFNQWYKTEKPKEFLDPLYSELSKYSDQYLDDILGNNGNIIRRGAIYNAAISNNYVTVDDGLRKTLHQPSTYKNSVYLLGASYLYGAGVEDSHTISSYLQEKLNACSEGEFIVHNYGVRYGHTFPNIYLQSLNLSLKEGDFLIVIVNMVDTRFAEDLNMKYILQVKKLCEDNFCSFIILSSPRLERVTNPSQRELTIESHTPEQLALNDINEKRFKHHAEQYTISSYITLAMANRLHAIDLQPICNRPHTMGEIFLDCAHYTYKVNERIAETIYELINPQKSSSILRDVDKESTIYLRDTIIASYGDQRTDASSLEYYSTFNEKYHKIGAIVMNANPFTNGHLYLVEYALKEVDALYVFVVEENKSRFSFEDRMALVKAGLGHLSSKPILVLPSGKFIISSFSFPEYFTKETKKYDIDSSLDVLLFGSLIAPKLGITDRFVGNEPTCIVTSDYNATMLRSLPHLGVSVHVVPRKTTTAGVISASTVRELVANREVAKLKSYVPPTTYAYLLSTM